MAQNEMDEKTLVKFDIAGNTFAGIIWAMMAAAMFSTSASSVVGRDYMAAIGQATFGGIFSYGLYRSAKNIREAIQYIRSNNKNTK